MTSNRQHKDKYSKAINNARRKSDVEFYSWFNTSTSVNNTLVRGNWDFALHILTPTVMKLIALPEEKTVLEIGFGGGRLLNSACRFFKHGIGVDIHNDFDKVQKLLEGQGTGNFKLLKTEGNTLPVKNASVDLIYSFIVLQHLPSFKTLEDYISETHRALKVGGVAQLYYGAFKKVGKKARLLNYHKGYVEIEAPPTDSTAYTSVAIAQWKFKQICKKAGLNVVASGVAFKDAPDGYPTRVSAQRFLTLQKL